ncbi:unnamed protein product [Rodentolepis nana]|uniref:Ion_trans domain-containing protein n=1 Tax=Rodentolepis nana TaxID=102285 RepID=A0A158QIJ7_RODNA|nr:unnamed protein product [Rodentolepis nana]
MSTHEMHSPECVTKASVLVESAIHYRSIQHRLDKNRIKIYRIYYSKPVIISSYICKAIFFLLPLFESPSSLTKSSDVRLNLQRPVVPCGILESIDFLCLCFFLVRSLMLAYLFWKEEFRRNYWLIGQFVVIFISINDVLVSMALGCSEFIRIRRFFRPYFLIADSQMLKKTIKCLLITIPELFTYLLLLLLWILFSTLIAICMFSGRKQTFSSPHNLFAKSEGVGIKWFYETFFNIIVLLTTANHPDLLLPNYNENRGAALFDVVFIAVGTYFFMYIFTAIMFNQFRGYLSSSIQKRMFRRRLAVFAAFQLLKSQDPFFLLILDLTTPSLFICTTLRREPVVESDKIRQVLEETSLSGWKKEIFLLKLEKEFSNISLKLGEFMDLFRLLELSSQPKALRHTRQFYNPVASRIQTFFLSDEFRWIELSISLANVTCIIVQLVAFEEEDKPSFRFLIINTVFALIYMAEIVLRIWFYGCRDALKRLSLFDTVLSSLNLTLRLVELALILCGLKSIPYLQWSPYNIGQVANVCVILRTVRFLQNSKLMKAILLKMPQHLAPVLGILACLYYVYALIGLTVFHGAIEPPSDNANATYLCGSYQELSYWSINFDDFAASLFTLWSLMVINNWHVIVRAFTEKRGRAVHFYMLSWWLIAVVIMATLITAMIIESFLFARQQCLDESGNKNYRPNSCGLISACRLRRRDNNDNHDTEPLVDNDIGEELNQVNQSNIHQESETGVQIITGDQNQNLSSLSPSSHHSSVTFSLAQILGGSFTEPTNEDLERHLSRHCEIVTRRGSESQVLLVEMNRPDAFNALSPNMVKELAEAVEYFEEDSSIRCLVLTGSTKSFSVGADIQRLEELRKAEVMQQWGAISSTTKPTIAAVNGAALGGGAELALACDVVYAGERARFGFPEIDLGILPGAGGTQRLVRAAGKSRAMEMILSGKAISAKEALTCGLVSKVHPVDEVVNASVDLAERISSHSLVALRASKKAINAAFQMSLNEGLHLERELFLKALSSSDGQEGIQAHLEKRPPKLGVSTALSGHTLYLFGGRTEDGTAMNDLSTFDLLTMEWNRLIPSGNRPLPRSDAIMGFVGEELFLFGGIRCIMDQPMSVQFFMIESSSLSDLFSYRQSTNSWNQLLKATETPRLSKYYSGAFLQAVDSDPDTFPPLLVIFENTGMIYRTHAIELRGMYHWNRLSGCPQNPSYNSTQAMGIDTPLNILPERPPMCALSETDVLMVTHFAINELPTFWILSRIGRTPQSGKHNS